MPTNKGDYSIWEFPFVLLGDGRMVGMHAVLQSASPCCTFQAECSQVLDMCSLLWLVNVKTRLLIIHLCNFIYSGILLKLYGPFGAGFPLLSGKLIYFY